MIKIHSSNQQRLSKLSWSNKNQINKKITSLSSISRFAAVKEECRCHHHHLSTLHNNINTFNCIQKKLDSSKGSTASVQNINYYYRNNNNKNRYLYTKYQYNISRLFSSNNTEFVDNNEDDDNDDAEVCIESDDNNNNIDTNNCTSNVVVDDKYELLNLIKKEVTLVIDEILNFHKDVGNNQKLNIQFLNNIKNNNIQYYKNEKCIDDFSIQEYSNVQVPIVSINNNNTTNTLYTDTLMNDNVYGDKTDVNFIKNENINFEEDNNFASINVNDSTIENQINFSKNHLKFTPVDFNVDESPIMIGNDSNDSTVENLKFTPIDRKEESPLMIENETYDHSLEPLSAALTLLRILSKKDWATFDNVSDGESIINDNELLDVTSIDSDSDTDTDNESDQLVDKEEVDNSFIDSILSQTKHGGIFFDTCDYNLLLAHISLSPEYTHDQMLNLLMQIHTQMIELSNLRDKKGVNSCLPDAITYEILFLAFSRRLHSFTTIGEMVSEILSRSKKSIPSLEWSPNLLEIVLEVCNDRSNSDLARRLLRLFPKNENTEANIYVSGEVTHTTYLSFINLLKSENAMEEGMQILKMALEASSEEKDRNLDALFIEVLRWPEKNRKGQLLDNTYILKQTIKLMENSISYSPSYFVWKQLIGTASWGADRNDTGWPLVAKAFGIMNEKQFWPDNTLLKHGMNACSALHNSRLAADLIALSIERELQQFESAELGMESDDIELYARLPFNDIKRAMDICAKTKDVRSCRDILRSVNTIRHYVLPSNIRSLYYLGLKIFAEAGELKLSDKILSYMIENDLNPSEEFYGAVIQAAGVSGDYNFAKQLLRNMESNDIAGVSPGIKSYEAFLLLAIKKEQWSEVNDVYETMQSTGVAPSQMSNYCKLLAAYKIGGRDEAKTFLETLVATKGNIGREIQFLSLKIFFPDTFEETCDISNIVVTLRQYFLSNSQLSCEQAKKRRTDLLRSLQISTIEDQRQPTGGLNLESIKERREVAWRDVLVKLLAYE